MPKWHQVSPDDFARMRVLARNGHDRRAIATRLGCSESTTYEWVPSGRERVPVAEAIAHARAMLDLRSTSEAIRDGRSVVVGRRSWVWRPDAIELLDQAEDVWLARIGYGARSDDPEPETEETTPDTAPAVLVSPSASPAAYPMLGEIVRRSARADALRIAAAALDGIDDNYARELRESADASMTGVELEYLAFARAHGDER